jgi:PKD repeat protein
MKKVLLTLFLLGGIYASSAQQSLILIYDAYTNAMGTAFAANQPVWVKVSTNLSTLQYQFTTNSNGTVYDTIPHPGTAATVTFITYDCQGNLISGTKSITPNNTYTGDTVIVPCALQLNCQSYMNVSGSASGLTYRFQDSSFSVPPTNDVSHISYWNFGDGNSTVVLNGWNASHTYAAPGVYNVCLVSVDEDTLNGVVLCADTVCKTVTVGGGNPAGFCAASYWLDTLGSGSGIVNIYNSSTPANSNAAYQNSYSWDFGDGSAAVSSAFPSHVYANPGMYQVCLTITSVDAQNNVCTDTYCDSLGMDANGNLIYKTNAGFTLNVLDPATIGLMETSLSEVKLYPNPAVDEVTVNLGANSGAVTWTLVDLKGTVLKTGTATQPEFTLNLATVPTGIYLIGIEGENQLRHFKLIVD